MRVDAPIDCDAASNETERPAIERAFDLQRRAAFATPGERRRDPAARTERVDKRRPGAVGEAVAILEPQNRQPHRRRAQTPRRTGNEYVARDAWLLVHQQDYENLRCIRD